MIEVSTSILSVEKGKEAETFFAIEKSKIRLFSYRCNGWKICRKRHISKYDRIQ